MKDMRLLASAALFRELYDNDNDIYDVISEFIRASIILNAKWTFNATECAQGLKSTFGFDIPSAVLKTCLKNRLKKTGEINISHSVYTVTEKLDRGKSIQTDFDLTKNEYEDIATKLVEHVGKTSTIKVNNERLKSCFNDYLLDEHVSNEYKDVISHFLLANAENVEFKKKLNSIEEGLILYEGIKYSAELSNLGQWGGDLVVFLDTEHLFSATGLNGILFKKVFDDFYSLVQEVNQSKHKRGRIRLRYFQETHEEVDAFFFAAEKIVEQHQQVDPSKTAMREIVNGCSSKSEVVSKKAEFLDNLRRLKIEKEGLKNYYENPEYNIERAQLIEKLIVRFNHKPEADRYSDILKKFTKINCLREGKNNVGIEMISAMFMTENRLIQSVAFSDVIHEGNGSIPFATNIEFLTERLWFKLNKGFGQSQNMPISFDVITKAKLVLSSQVNNAVAETYKELKSKHQQGKISEKETALLIAELRSKPSKPEDISIEIIDESLDFLHESFVESVLEEKSLLEERSKKGEQAMLKLKELEYIRRVELNKPLKSIAKRKFYAAMGLIYIFLPILLVTIVMKTYSSDDTVLSLIFGAVTVIGVVTQSFKFDKIKYFLWGRSTKHYKRVLKKR
jgi:hypothetical protein